VDNGPNDCYKNRMPLKKDGDKRNRREGARLSNKCKGVVLVVQSSMVNTGILSVDSQASQRRSGSFVGVFSPI